MINLKHPTYIKQRPFMFHARDPHDSSASCGSGGRVRRAFFGCRPSPPLAGGGDVPAGPPKACDGTMAAAAWNFRSGSSSSLSPGCPCLRRAMTAAGVDACPAQRLRPTVVVASSPAARVAAAGTNRVVRRVIGGDGGGDLRDVRWTEEVGSGSSS